MHDVEEHSLVCKAVRECLGGCFDWDERGARLVRQDWELQGLTPEFLRTEVCRHVRSEGDHEIIQVLENREEYRDDYRFYYKVILPIDGFRHGVFVEMILTGSDDPEFPEVTIVRAHLQRK
ncbi:MAG: hypothetical protein P4L85_24890 [Paludisphaera borealis]|uniref:hypothetical protein n=1 Tax=Paludisphaera borealis TaxID=1387353 RepID=UPI00284208A6|nr:hypothetical protein [Paludisphaera borealis]MDR3622612.1 hypothetical protein [Paludisphaera borealis]